MRKLTITRNKAFTASLATMKVYIEDPDSQELEIQGVPCRKLGVLKNGETKTFEIRESAAKVYVIGDKLSRNYANDFVQIPAGTEDITLSGKNHYNPAGGNPFYFDGHATEEVLANRKRNKKTGWVIIIVSAIVGLAIGLLQNLPAAAKPKDFSVDGMTVTLTDKFRSVEEEGFNACYGTDKQVVLVIKEDFSLFEGAADLTKAEYAQLTIDAYSLSETAKVQEKDGLTYFEYQANTYHYLAVVYKSQDAFWLIQFCSNISDAADFESEFMAMAKTVKFQ